MKCEYKTNPIGIDAENPGISWQIKSDGKNIIQSAYHIQVAIGKADFSNMVWDTGKVISEQSIHVRYQGEKLMSRTRYYFRVKLWDNKEIESAWSEPFFWEMGLLHTREWKAEWITFKDNKDNVADDVCPLLRKTFKLEKRIRSARIYATSLGLYELYINGSRVGDFLFTPGWTSYNKRLQYQTYDVTDMLRHGENAVGATLGNGWYKGYLGFDGKNNTYGNKLGLLFQMNITFEDGEEEIITSDDSWKSSAGPILMSEIYNGETYDARQEKTGWNDCGFEDSGWSRTFILKHSKDILLSQINEPVKRIEEIRPIAVLKTPKNETVLDFGQNMVGWVRFKVKGKKNNRVILKHAEVLDKNGNFYTENLKQARQTIEYVLNGNGIETFEPHFTFQGFRYVKVEEYPGEPLLEDFTGIVIHSALRPTGSFECSDKRINQLQHNILWGQKGNFLDVPTDCPQRNERLGWTGDAQVFARTACFNMDTALFLKKWLGDVKADQKPNGAIPIVIPSILSGPFGDDASSGWGDAGVIIPWTLYLCYGDKSILEEQYDSMKAYIEYIRSVAEDGVLWNTGFHFGDWLALDAREGSYEGATPNDLISTAYYAHSTDILARSASILGKTKDAGFYRVLYESILKAFQNEFISPRGRLVAPTQTAHVLTLMFNLAEEKDRKRIVDTLVEYLKKKKWHLDTGFLGTPYLCHVLGKNGRADVAYKLLFQTDYPSWLYQVEKGATTIWEHWDGIKEDGSFWSADMNSFNHYAYGAIGDWLYRTVAGISIDENRPGYKHILINPQPCRELSWAEAQLETLYGLVKAKWNKTDGIMLLEVTVPHNTTASVTLPYAEINGITENGKAIKDTNYSAQKTDSGAVVELGSGTYNFSYRINENDIFELPIMPPKAPWEA